jgi:Putative ATPase subunit of terminase (gpP-like)
MDTINKPKGRMTSVDRDYKKSQGKDLFVKGFSITNISEIIGVGIKTVSGWRDLHNWESEKEINAIRPSEIKKLILQYVLDIKDGKKPQHKADDLSKISAAFDRLNDDRKKAVYTMESIDGFSQFMMVLAGNNTGKKRDEVLELLQNVRVYFDKYVSELLDND